MWMEDGWVETLARSVTRRMTIGARATKLATHTVFGRWTDGSRRMRQFGIVRRFGFRARTTGRLAHCPSAALSQGRSATRRTTIGARATKLATPTTCGWRTAGSRRSCNQTCNPNYMWMEDGWVETNETVWDCEDLTVNPVESADPVADAEAEDEKGTCSQNGASCALSQCCSEPGSTCYKKNDYWSSCNQTCNPYSLWTVDGWVTTNETVWDCTEIRPPCSQPGASCALSQCCSEPGASCYKKNDYWFACNLTCDPNSMWMEDRWVKTNETVWDCEVISIDSTANSTDAADIDASSDSASSSGAATASACSPNGESCALTMCCSEPGAKCYKKNDHWSSCNQTCNPYSLWTVDGWVTTNETVWDCEEIRLPCTHNGASCALSQCCSDSCNQTCNPNYMWMEDGWVETDETVWDCEDLTVNPVESADPISVDGGRMGHDERDSLGLHGDSAAVLAARGVLRSYSVLL
ncbi:unnamed protein product [Prorocentrum cordatum]|uniref:Cellulase n=1 Tax=Prorocentrum cordatum TaxID=2364126 RepID=A0ABN9QUB3_9DINO|nr:unnamed protein product [Polarella glacialis]